MLPHRSTRLNPRLSHHTLPALLCLLFFVTSNVAQAHFVWTYTDAGQVKVVFGEGLEPDEAKFLGGLKTMQAYKVVDGKRVAIELDKKTEDNIGWFETSVDKSGHIVDIHVPYGVFGRGDKSMLLDYSAKYINTTQGAAAKPSTELTLDLVPTFENGQLKITAYFNGYPIEGIEIQAERLASDSAVATTGVTGHAVLSPNSRYVIRGKHVVDEAGELNGDKYDQKRFYCTLVIDTHPIATPAANQETVVQDAPSNKATITLKAVETDLEAFPKGMTSFGATVVGNQIFVIGGKSGKAHAYAKSYQNRDVFCLATDGSNNQWQTVGENHGLQGLAIVGHGNKVYRIGGLEARNKEGEDDDLHSVADFKQFDPTSKTWTDLPSLPAGRSSIDACVVDSHVYVVGGWTLGDEDSVWATSMLKFDLNNPAGQWEKVDVPFKTRALAVEAVNNQLVVVGGLKENGGPTDEVYLYDLKTNQWSVGPAVPTPGRMKAFGCSTTSVAGCVLASTYDGGIYQLAADNDSWTKIHQLDDGRFFHQMLPIADNQVALVGGSHMQTGSHFDIEVFEATASEDAAASKDAVKPEVLETVE